MNLERKYSKDELLEVYLNRIYFGHGVYGIQAASSYYFQKDVQQLTVEEGALLAALPKAPNVYSPFINKNCSKDRLNLVLSIMHKEDYLTAALVDTKTVNAIFSKFMTITTNLLYFLCRDHYSSWCVNMIFFVISIRIIRDVVCT